MNKAEFGIIGLGVMGANLAANAAEKGISISVYNRSEGIEARVVANFLKDHPGEHIQGHTQLADFVTSLARPRKILIMVPAGAPVDEVIDQLTPLLDRDDSIIDGGNSHYKDTFRRCGSLQQKGMAFFGVGVSGGASGARNGPSMMVGGQQTNYYLIQPILESMAAKDPNGNPCVAYLGPQGCGHFVKMVHNGIEYAEMQLLAEVYALLKPSLDHDTMAELLSEWNEGLEQSFLLETTINILRKKENGTPLLEKVLDVAASKGTGSWTVQAAAELGAPASFTASALFARSFSSLKKKRKQLAALSNAAKKDALITIEALQNAYQWARVLNHHEGLQLIQMASDHYGWDVSLQEITRVWTNGCILASTLVVDISKVISEEDFLQHPVFESTRKNGVPALETILTEASAEHIAAPCLSNALQYWYTMSSVSSPANLIQAQRDSFGAHTYRRIDRLEDESFTTNWNNTHG